MIRVCLERKKIFTMTDEIRQNDDLKSGACIGADQRRRTSISFFGILLQLQTRGPTIEANADCEAITHSLHSLTL